LGAAKAPSHETVIDLSDTEKVTVYAVTPTSKERLAWVALITDDKVPVAKRHAKMAEMIKAHVTEKDGTPIFDSTDIKAIENLKSPVFTALWKVVEQSMAEVDQAAERKK
jgi:hypothetical protein